LEFGIECRAQVFALVGREPVGHLAEEDLMNLGLLAVPGIGVGGAQLGEHGREPHAGGGGHRGGPRLAARAGACGGEASEEIRPGGRPKILTRLPESGKGRANGVRRG